MNKKFKELNKELTGSEFVKKYEWLGKIITNKNDINAIELILSFQLNNKTFTASDAYIGHRISMSTTSVNAVLLRLENAGFITRKTIFNGKTRQNDRTIKVNCELLVSTFKSLNVEQIIEDVETSTTNKPVATDVYDTRTEAISLIEKLEPTPIVTKINLKIVSEDLPNESEIIEVADTSERYIPELYNFDIAKLLRNYLGNADDNFTEQVKAYFKEYLSIEKSSGMISMIDFYSFMRMANYDTDKCKTIIDGLAEDISKFEINKKIS